ncbi:hypothetical protein IWQ62_000050 [Dispira parvispora]|uniref:Fe2OG dioxygenase domain-containing protein n=1 Tax=Dispira parvispora TaxID=1520584 RepID=A0A9W8E6F6_9FUNG|nr:hypothetical protein IWQ62_000050 [Dispira parvispora]
MAKRKPQPKKDNQRLPSIPSTVEWPRVQTKKGLTLTELVTDHVYTISNLFSSSECLQWIALAEHQLGFPSVPRQIVPKRGEAFRNNARISILDPNAADQLWHSSGLAQLIQSEWSRGKSLARLPSAVTRGKQPVGLNGQLRLYRYDPGQRFGKHYDDTVIDTLGRQSEFTLLIYLNDAGTDPLNVLGKKSHTSSAGGETVFHIPQTSQPLSITPRGGLALLHRHGANCLLHEANPVHGGVKYILRSDIVFS